MGMPSLMTEPDPMLLPAEDERVLPGPPKAPTLAVTASFVMMAVLMMVGAVLLG